MSMKSNENCVIVVGGQKGGVGKTLVSLCIIDLFMRAGKKIIVIDADDNNTDVYLACEDEPSITCIFQTLDNETDASLIGEIIEEHQNDIIVMNMAARTKITDYIGAFSDVCKHENRELIVFWPINAELDSLQSALDCFEACNDAPFFVVLNTHFGQARNFRLFHKNKEQFGDSVITIELPVLSSTTMAKIRSNRLNFTSYMESRDKNGQSYLTEMDKSLVLRFRNNVKKCMSPFIEMLGLDFGGEFDER